MVNTTIDKDAIRIIITGGTIDSAYDGTKDTVVPNEKSMLPRFVQSLKLYRDVSFTEVCMKDSRDLDKGDLEHIKKTIENCLESKIIITHGTYTMPDTGRFLEANLKRKDQVIIITGSMIPISGFTFSDAPFNIGYSISKSEDLDPGVYICMNGRIFSSNEVMKVSTEGRFHSIFGEKEN